MSFKSKRKAETLQILPHGDNYQAKHVYVYARENFLCASGAYECVHVCVSTVWCIIHMTCLSISALILHTERAGDRCMHSLHADIWLACQLPGMCAAKGSQGAKWCAPLSQPASPTPNPFASPLTLQPRCGVGPVRSSANRREPVLGATSPPASSFLWLLPPICAYTHTHIRINVLMRASHCLYSLCDIRTSHHTLTYDGHSALLSREHSSFWFRVSSFNCSCFHWFFFIVIKSDP